MTTDPLHFSENRGPRLDCEITRSKMRNVGMAKVMGFEVNKLSEFFIKTSNVSKYIESDIQNLEALRTYDPLI